MRYVYYANRVINACSRYTINIMRVPIKAANRPIIEVRVISQLHNWCHNIFSIRYCLHLIQPYLVTTSCNKVFKVRLIGWYPLDLRGGVGLVELAYFLD